MELAKSLDDGDVVITPERKAGLATHRERENKSLTSNPSKIFTGTSIEEHDKANRTYLNELGPGQYNLPAMTGRHSIEAKRRNLPSISFGPKTKQPWHPEYATDFVGKTSPAPTRYSPQPSKLAGRNIERMGKFSNDKKFREPSSITTLRETLPVAYSG